MHFSLTRMKRAAWVRSANLFDRARNHESPSASFDPGTHDQPADWLRDTVLRGTGSRASQRLTNPHAQSLLTGPIGIAVIHAGLGDKDAAFTALEQAFTERSYLLAEYFNTDERLASLKSDPRLDARRSRMGLPKLDN